MQSSLCVSMAKVQQHFRKYIFDNLIPVEFSKCAVPMQDRNPWCVYYFSDEVEARDG